LRRRPNAGEGVVWCNLLQPYVKSTQIFQCPSDTQTAPANQWYWQDSLGANGIHTSYMYNSAFGDDNSATNGGIAQASVQNVATTVLAVDGGTHGNSNADVTQWAQKEGAFMISPIPDDNNTPQSANYDIGAPHARHLETSNVLFADGHVKALRVTNFYKPMSGTTAMPCFDYTKGCE
jgi:prepilin-type processing-associated H-X9-DG protein